MIISRERLFTNFELRVQNLIIKLLQKTLKNTEAFYFLKNLAAATRADKRQGAQAREQAERRRLGNITERNNAALIISNFPIFPVI